MIWPMILSGAMKAPTHSGAYLAMARRGSIPVIEEEVRGLSAAETHFSSTSAVDQRIDHIQYRFQIGKDADAYRRMSDSKESDWEV